MADFRMALGGTFSAATTDEMNSALGSLKGDILGGMKKEKPIRRTIFGSGGFSKVQFGTQQALHLKVDGTPSVNRLWVIRSVVVYDSLAALTAANANLVGTLCIGDAANPAPVDMRGWTFVGIPNANTFNSSSLRVNANENIYIMMNSDTPLSISANVEIDEWLVSSYVATHI